MPLPHWIARFNRRATNRVLGPVVMRLPGFGMLVHRGRSSGATYRTPLMLFRRPGGYVIALTYGPHTDWVCNVLDQGCCQVEMRGDVHELSQPRLLHDETRRCVPWIVRLPLRVLGVRDFLELSFAGVEGRADGTAGP